MHGQSAAIATTEIARLVLEHYGINAAVTPLTGERDSNYRIDDRSGRFFVFKLAHPDEPERTTRLQIDALLWLESHPPEGLSFPRIELTMRGNPSIVVSGSDGRRRIGRLVRFVSGQLLRGVPSTAAQRRSCGRALAHLAMAFRGFKPQDSNHALIWDLRHAPAVRELLDTLDAQHQETASHVLDRFDERVGKRFGELPQQIVHNDFNRGNVLVSADDTDRVTGVIDFGDVVRTARVADLAIGAASQILPGHDPVHAISDFIAGYCSVSPITEMEWDALATLVATRLVMTAVIPLWHRSQNPDNPHYQSIGVEDAGRWLAASQAILDNEGTLSGRTSRGAR